MNYEPPNGMRAFVHVLQRASPDDAADVLRLTFENVYATALVDEARLRRAAPALLNACRLALLAAENNGLIDLQEIAHAVASADSDEVPRAR